MTIAGCDAVHHAWQHSTAGKTIAACLTQASGSDGAAAMHCFDRLFDDTSWTSALLRHFGAALRLSPGMALPMRSFTNGVIHSMMVASAGGVDISLAVIDAQAWRHARSAQPKEQPVIISLPSGWLRIKFIHAGGAHLQRYRLDTRDRLCAAPPVRLRHGDVLTLDQAYEGMHFLNITNDIVMLRVLVRDGNASIAHEFIATSGERILAAASQGNDTRIEMMLALLRAMRRSDAVPVMIELSRSGNPHQRWQAMRESLALDPRAAMPHLRAMERDDSCADIRATARQTLDYLRQTYPALASDETTACPA